MKNQFAVKVKEHRVRGRLLWGRGGHKGPMEYEDLVNAIRANGILAVEYVRHANKGKAGRFAGREMLQLWKDVHVMEVKGAK